MAVRFLYSEYTFQRVLVLRRTQSHYYPHKNFPLAWRRGANQYFSSGRVLIMTDKIKCRPIEPEDGPGLDALISYNPSSGSISFSYDYQADILEVNKAFANDLHGIVATIDSTIIAMVFGDRLEVQWEGEIYPAAYISNMRVQSEHRRKHIARGMSEYGIQYAEDILGSDSVYYSAVPAGNISMGLSKAFQFTATSPIQGGIVPMRSSPPKNIPDLTVRKANRDDLSQIAEGMNAFYREHNLWSPVSPEFLQDFLDVEVAGVQPNQLYVVTRNDQVLGGLSLSDRTNLVRMKLVNVPGYVSALGALLRVLPKSGILRALTIRRVWFSAGELEAARFLWQSLRFKLRDQGDSLGIAYDPRDRLAEVFQVPFWLPMFKAYYFVKAGAPIDPDRRIYCLAGP
jgi:hypothetical protein